MISKTMLSAHYHNREVVAIFIFNPAHVFNVVRKDYCLFTTTVFIDTAFHKDINPCNDNGGD